MKRVEARVGQFMSGLWIIFAVGIFAIGLSRDMTQTAIAQTAIAQANTRQADTGHVSARPVTLLKTPDDGIQPQAALDSKGVLHLIYFKGKPGAGDIFYVRRKPGENAFSVPLRVNSQTASAVAMGTIRGAQIAIGQDERVHVTWNGSSSAQPKGPGGNPMLYARLNDTGTAFEPQRNLITWAGGIDGGGTIAADDKGHVFVAWHALAGAADENGRAVFLACSADNGSTFAREKKISTQPSGACSCCQMRGLVDGKGVLYFLYRTAGHGMNRDSTLLMSRDMGQSFQSTTLHKWNIAACPMSSYSLAARIGSEGTSTIDAAWETAEQVYYSTVQSAVSTQPATVQFSAPVAAPVQGANRKHPVLVHDVMGEMLFAWTEGTGWNKGGSLAWQIYDENGRPTGEKGRADGVPVWGLLSAVARPDGGFILIY